MIRAVRLERLPADLQFPQELRAKISFDAAHQQLQYDGFMSKTDFDKLVRLSNDLAYQRSLEKLFQVCTFVVQQPPRAERRWTWIVTGAALALAITLFFVLMRHG